MLSVALSFNFKLLIFGINYADCVFLFDMKLIYVIYRAGGPYGKKLSPKSWPRAVLKTKGTVFYHTDRPRPVNNLFIFFCLFAFFSLGRV